MANNEEIVQDLDFENPCNAEVSKIVCEEENPVMKLKGEISLVAYADGKSDTEFHEEDPSEKIMDVEPSNLDTFMVKESDVEHLKSNTLQTQNEGPSNGCTNESNRLFCKMEDDLNFKNSSTINNDIDKKEEEIETLKVDGHDAIFTPMVIKEEPIEKYEQSMITDRTSVTNVISDMNVDHVNQSLDDEVSHDILKERDEFCDMSDLAFVAGIVSTTLNSNVDDSIVIKKEKDDELHNSEYDDLLNRASAMLGKKLESIDSDSSGTTDSESTSSSSSSSSESSDEEVKNAKLTEILQHQDDDNVNPNPPKTKDEILPEDLPDDPELKIDLPDDAALSPVGELQSLVEKMIVIKAIKDNPALDAETILFKKDRKPIGMIFDVFGPVQSPFYVIRVSKQETFDNLGLEIGEEVYYAPSYLKLTHYVFVAQLKRIKGSDASWNHDQEPPSDLVEYSDDEEESKAKSAAKKKRQLNRQKLNNDAQDADDEIDAKDPQRRKKETKGHARNHMQTGASIEMPNSNAAPFGSAQRTHPQFHQLPRTPFPHKSERSFQPRFSGGPEAPRSFGPSRMRFQNHPRPPHNQARFNGPDFSAGRPPFPPPGFNYEAQNYPPSTAAPNGGQFHPPPPGYRFPPAPNSVAPPPFFPSHIPPPNWRPQY